MTGKGDELAPTRTHLAAYALPALPLAALTLPLYILVPTFYTETLGLSLAAVGAALLFVRIFDAFNDPLIGWAADRFRPRFGRRRTLLALVERHDRRNGLDDFSILLCRCNHGRKLRSVAHFAHRVSKRIDLRVFHARLVGKQCSVDAVEPRYARRRPRQFFLERGKM